MISTQQGLSFHSLDCGPIPAQVNFSRFQGQSGVVEYHLTVHPTDYAGFPEQLEWTLSAYLDALNTLGLDTNSGVFRRFLCSDLPNQAAELEEHSLANPRSSDEPCAVSWVSQPPASPAKVALWAYHIEDPNGALDKWKVASLSVRRGELTHVWTTGLTCTDQSTSYGQTKGILKRYESYLQAQGLNLADHVIRTWFFVRNIDANYHGLVEARKEAFAQRGLTPDTHFIASTGIEGASSDTAAEVLMDAYAISGVRKDQIRFLCAPEHLCPTHIYGVTFERGVSVDYRDRRHILISGTASIDSAGTIVHPGDVLRQLDRTLENVEALLRQAEAGLQDVCAFIVYARDPADVGAVACAMRERLGPAPIQTVVAPVCRPGWLVEIECMAIVTADRSELPAF